jgi:TonB family protein
VVEFRIEKYQSAIDKQSYEQAEQRAKNSKRGVWSDSFKTCKDAAVEPSVETAAELNPEKTKLPKLYGIVTVEVMIDESGNVVSARALCGHPVLQTSAVRAALQSKFKPKQTAITGSIIYNFVP